MTDVELLARYKAVVHDKNGEETFMQIATSKAHWPHFFQTTLEFVQRAHQHHVSKLWKTIYKNLTATQALRFLNAMHPRLHIGYILPPDSGVVIYFTQSELHKAAPWRGEIKRLLESVFALAASDNLRFRGELGAVLRWLCNTQTHIIPSIFHRKILDAFAGGTVRGIYCMLPSLIHHVGILATAQRFMVYAECAPYLRSEIFARWHELDPVQLRQIPNFWNDWYLPELKSLRFEKIMHWSYEHWLLLTPALRGKSLTSLPEPLRFWQFVVRLGNLEDQYRRNLGATYARAISQNNVWEPLWRRLHVEDLDC